MLLTTFWFKYFADDCVSLYSAGIQTNSNLFVWNGREVRNFFLYFKYKSGENILYSNVC